MCSSMKIGILNLTIARHVKRILATVRLIDDGIKNSFFLEKITMADLRI